MRLVFIISLFLIFSSELFSQNYLVSGYIEDASTGERLIGAMIYDSISLSGSGTNSYGYFSFRSRKGQINLNCSYVGYKRYRTNFFLTSDTIINIMLEPQTYKLAEVIVGDKKRLIERTGMSITEIPLTTIKQMPMLMGETDVLKVLQSLPGVQSGTEGTSGLYVRGGGPDQNLILLDGVTVYNPDHLFGFISVFNPDAIKNVTFISGGFPARYGGRLSSVIDIRMKEGNNKEFHGEGTLGFLSSKITLEGPIKNVKTSYLISARRSWIDLFTRSLLKDRDLPCYYFYDLTGKINHIFSDKSRLYLSVYTGKDHISSINTTTQFTSENTRHTYKAQHYLGWGNITSALRWNYIFNSRLFINTSITYSKYRYLDNRLFHNTHVSLFNGKVTNEDYKSDFQSGIEDISLRSDFDYQPFKGHNLKFGIAAIYHNFTPRAHISVVNPGNDSVTFNIDRREYTGVEPSIYLEDEIDLSRNLKIDAGLRLSAFLVKEKKYTSIEPRFSGRYLITDRWALKLAYSRMNQYVHLLTSSRITFPTDLWVPATDKVRPQLADQIALGSVYNIDDNFELNIETYYKSMKHLIEYGEGISFLEAGNWESKIEQGGIGRAYGFELMLKKNTGRTTGWLSYTLSKTERRFETISSGRWFPYKYDRRHDINIIINHRFSDRIDAGLTWEFSSGNMFTLNTDVYDSYFDYPDFKNISYFENRNNYRLPAYHRLDMGINFHKQKKIFYRTWSISIYNVYNRMNVFFVYLGNDDVHGKKDLLLYKKYTLFPVLPSVTYSLKF